MRVVDITEINFEEEVLEYNGIAIVKFYGSWCGPCKMLASVLEEMDEYDNLKVVGLDVDKNMTLAKQFGVMSVPTLLVFKDGAEVDKIVGFRSKSQLDEIFTNYVNSGK